MSDGRGTRSYQVRRERGLSGYGERVIVGWEESKEIIEEVVVDVNWEGSREPSEEEKGVVVITWKRKREEAGLQLWSRRGKKGGYRERGGSN